jgi:hypothetical protein
MERTGRLAKTLNEGTVSEQVKWKLTLSFPLRVALPRQCAT